MLAGLLILFSFLELLSQLNDVGKGQYRLSDAFLFVALTTPKHAVYLMPMSALLGSTVALGMMADHQELTAMQAAGISVRRISMSVVVTSLILMVIAVLVTEFIAPPLDQHARLLRSEARYGKTVLISKSGFWVRQGQFLIHVGGSFSEQRASDVELFELDQAGQIRQFIHARRAHFQKDQNWLLEDVSRQVVEGDVIRAEQMTQYRLEGFLTPNQVQILKLPPDSLSLSDLHAYIRNLRAREQNTKTYEHAFWQKICQPVTTSAMVLFALTFIFGPVRVRTAGKRIAIGTIVGIMLYFIIQILGYLGLLLNLPPTLTTLAPVGLILIFALRQLRRAF
jgi:lipopolysaccharide export system permease protein